MTNSINQKHAPRRRLFYSVASMMFLTVLAIAFALALDTNELINAAYSLPMLAWRLLTYSIIMLKAPKDTRLVLVVFVIFNELVIWSYWEGRLPWS